jgi:hypothetical protein
MQRPGSFFGAFRSRTDTDRIESSVLLGLGEFRVAQPGDGEAASEMQRKSRQAKQAQRNRSAVGRHRSRISPLGPGGILLGGGEEPMIFLFKGRT